MKIIVGLYSISYFIAVVLGVFSSLLLIFSYRNRFANRLLGLMVLAITGWLFDAFLRVSGLYTQNANLYFLPIYYSFAFGPLLYLYVKAITNSAFKFKSIYLLHFIPVLIQALFYWIVAFHDYAFKYKVWFNLHLPYTYRIEYDGTWLSLVIYLICAVIVVKNYQHWLKENYSDVSRKNLNWLKICLLLMIATCICWLFEAFLRDAKNIYYKYDFSSDLLAVLVFILSVLSYRQANTNVVFSLKDLTEPTRPTTAADQSIIQRIETAMADGKLYLNPELSLAELARYINLPAKTVSLNINAAFNKPFNTYVNTWRVNEVKRRLGTTDAEKFTLLSIAYESGFNSKTSFNRTFKEITGSTPSKFINRGSL